ncbi:MAG TPA: SDR family oxidoreductase [Polyangiaceae bacterium]|nr:SDR family oxidoreductase [Polyangiaceae bacterium]
MRILFIGGTGIISSACSDLALARGLDLYLLNRGKSELRPAPRGAKLLSADISDRHAVENALGSLTFDAVVNFVVFTEDQIQRDIELFGKRTAQYVFISSASAYQTPPTRLPVTESTPLHNPFWQYSRNKIACEERLLRAHREQGFPATVVRPSHTYDRTLWPMHGGYTAVDRMRRGRPVVVHGDGTSLWTLTHHRDFAAAFVPLLGHDGAIGEAFHITSDEWLTWNQIHEIVARAAGTRAELVHVPSEVIATHDPEWGASLLGDKTHSMVFDNTKIKRLVPDYRASIPFSQGVHEIVGFYDQNPQHRQIDRELDRLMDKLIDSQVRERRAL